MAAASCWSAASSSLSSIFQFSPESTEAVYGGRGGVRMGLRVMVELFGALEVVEIDAPLVRRAIGIHRRYQIAYWDALIVTAAERSCCDCVLSEDLHAGLEYGKVVVENPFVGV